MIYCVDGKKATQTWHSFTFRARSSRSVWKHTTRRVTRISRWQSGAEAWVSANTLLTGKANIFPFSTRQRDPRAWMSVFARQTGLWLLVRRGDQYLVAPLSRCWNACFTFLHQSLLCCSLPTVPVEAETRREKERTELEPWDFRSVKGSEVEENNRILNLVMIFWHTYTFMTVCKFGISELLKHKSKKRSTHL